MRTAFLAAMVVAACVFFWKGSARAEESRGSDDAKLGKQIYLWTGCAICHGKDARGAWKGPDLTDPQLLRVRSDENLFDVIKHGRPDTMMGFYRDELADEQISLIVAYLRNEGRIRSASRQP